MGMVFSVIAMEAKLSNFGYNVYNIDVIIYVIVNEGVKVQGEEVLALENELRVRNEDMVLPFWPSFGDSYYLNTIADGDLIYYDHQEEIFGFHSDPYGTCACQCHFVRAYRAQPQQQEEEEDAEQENEDGVRGFRDAYQGMSRGDCQTRQGSWVDQKDGRWGHLDTWMTRQD
nr:hypothetical protein [Tanacetum cinerariifolium]